MTGRPELIAIINTVYDAVDASKMGPMLISKIGEERTYSGVALQTFQNVLAQMVPKAMDVSGEMDMSGTVTERKIDGTVVTKTYEEVVDRDPTQAT